MLVSFVFLCVFVVARAQSGCGDGGAWAEVIGFVKVSASIGFGSVFVG